MADPRTSAQELVYEEIRRLVADAIENRDILHTGLIARKITKTYGDFGSTAEEIALEVATVAAKAGVPVEISRPSEASLRPLSG
jgi:hypothetical protein